MECVESSSSLAWRLLATLEGGTILLATSALLAYTVRKKVVRRHRPPAKHVLVTNTTNILGKEMKEQLERRGCAVSTVTSGAGAGASAGAGTVDALVVVGAETTPTGLEGLSDSISEDVYENMKILDSLSPLVRPGGCIAWACAGAACGNWSDAGNAFDTVLQASLQNVANNYDCEAVWIGRCKSATDGAEKIASILTCPAPEMSTFNIRYAAQKLTECVCKWLKIAT